MFRLSSLCDVMISLLKAMHRSAPHLHLIKPSHLPSCLPACLLSCQVCVENPELYAYDEEVVRKAREMGHEGLVHIRQRQDSFLFAVESSGALTVERMFLDAIDVLRQKLEEVRLPVEGEDAVGDAHLPAFM